MVMTVLDSVDLGQGVTIDSVVDLSGGESWRVCSKGICRFAENIDVAQRYAEHFGWKPQRS